MVLFTVHDGLRSGISAKGLALVQAAWARMCGGTRNNGSAIETNDPVWPELNVAAKEARTHPRRWLEMRNYYGDLRDSATVASDFEMWLPSMYRVGMAGTLRANLDDN